MLSKLQFAATAHVPSNYKITLKKVEVFYTSGKIHNKAHIDLNHMDVDLVSDAYYTGGEAVSAGVLYSSDSGLLLSHSESVSLVNQESDNYLMLLPQVYEEGDIYLTVSYDIDGSDDAHYGDGEGANLKDSYTDVKILLPRAIGEGGSNTGWQKGKQYTYILDITADEVTFGSVQVADWGAQTDTNVPDIPVVRHIFYQDGVYHINSAEGLKIFSAIVNGDNVEKVAGYTNNGGVPNQNDANAQLDSNIDLSTVCGPEIDNWVPIGDESKQSSYVGQFDGQDHYVDNVYIDRDDRKLGLFGNVHYGGVIRNVKLRGAQLRGPSYVGGLFAFGVHATVTNCHIEADAIHPVNIQTQSSGGVLIGAMDYTTVTDCSVCANGGNITIKGGNHLGGLIGYIYNGTIKNSSVSTKNDGQLDVNSTGLNVGGFAGKTYGGSVVFINSNISSEDLDHTPINISSPSGPVGGFVGYSSTTKFVGCYSAVSKVISGNNAVGYGIGQASSNVYLYSCWAYCATAPTQDMFVGKGSFANDTTLWGTSPISYTDNKAALENSINNYNAGAPADKQAVPFNAQGTYGPIVTTELPD